jgi:hypothetical protein
MGLFLLFLFPFYWMIIRVAGAGQRALPAGTRSLQSVLDLKPTWDHFGYLFEETLSRLAEHDVHNPTSTTIRCACSPAILSRLNQ